MKYDSPSPIKIMAAMLASSDTFQSFTGAESEHSSVGLDSTWSGYSLSALQRQSVILSLAVCARVSESAGHASQLLGPSPVLYMPDSQAVHLDAGTVIAPEYPALHRHCDTDVAGGPPAAVSLLSGHALQAAAPVALLYWLCGHATHLEVGEVIVPVYPTSHTQSVADFDAVPSVIALAGHGVHVAADPPAPNVPLGQGLHWSPALLSVPPGLHSH